MSQIFKKISFFLILTVIFFINSVKSDNYNDTLFEIKLNVNKIKSENLKPEGKLDEIFISFEDKFYASYAKQKKFIDSFKEIKTNNSLEVITNQELFIWDSIKIKDFNFNHDFKIEHMGNLYRLENAKNSSVSERVSFNKIYDLNLSENIYPRDDFAYILQRELNLDSTYGWTYNIKNDYSWIRSRDFPKDVSFDKIQLEFYNYRDFDYFHEIFRRSTMKFKKKSVSHFSPLYGNRILLFDYLPSYYEIEKNIIKFSFILPNSFTNKYYLDELIISSPTVNFIKSEDDTAITAWELLLKNISMYRVFKDDQNVIWYTVLDGTNDIIIDLSNLNIYEKGTKKSFKIISNEDFEFNYQLGSTYKSWSELYHNINLEDKSREVENYFNNKLKDGSFKFDDKCFEIEKFNISKKIPYMITIKSKEVVCKNHIKELDQETFLISNIYYVDDSKIKKITNIELDKISFYDKLKSNLMLIIDFILILILLIYIKFSKIFSSFIRNQNNFSENKIIFISILFFSLINVKLFFLILIFIYYEYIKNFYFNKL